MVEELLLGIGAHFTARLITKVLGTAAEVVAGKDLNRRIANCYQEAARLLVEECKKEGWAEERLEALLNVLRLPEVEKSIAISVYKGGSTVEGELGSYFEVGVVRERETTAPEEETDRFITDYMENKFLVNLYELLTQAIKDPDIVLHDILSIRRQKDLSRVLEKLLQELKIALKKLRQEPARLQPATKAQAQLGHERPRVINLRPLDVTHTFKNRLCEMRALCEYLAEGGVRLVSVVGRGGMGKTALVSRVLLELERGILPIPHQAKEFPVDGILYLSARSTGLGLERIYADMYRMFGEPAASRLAACWADTDITLAAKVEFLLETMQEGMYLILLDNLEDYLADDGNIADEGLRLFVERCLTQPSGARLIVTSRVEIQLTPAALHGARNITMRDGLPEGDAVALLRDLDPQGKLGLRNASEEDLHRAAQLTLGIPRALETLAGILSRAPTASLLRLLADKRLFGEEVLEKLVAEGYQHLKEDERRIMEALAVYDRPVDQTAVAYLLNPWFPGLDVRTCLRSLNSLTRAYFVSASRVTGEYSLHLLDREYAYHQIPTTPRVEEPYAYTRRNLELRAAGFYVSVRKPENEWQSIDDLAPQLAEFEHRARGEDFDIACQVLESVDYDYLRRWGHYTRIVALRQKLLGHLTVPVLQAKNLASLGRAYSVLGQLQRAAELHEEALVIIRDIGDRVEKGRHLDNLGLIYLDLGQFEKAVGLYEQAAALARENNDHWNECVSLGRLGVANRCLGQVEEGIQYQEKALAIARKIDDRRRVGVELGGLGTSYRDLGQFARAIQFYQEALAIAREVSDRRREGIWLGFLSIVYRYLGQFEEVLEYHKQAIGVSLKIGDHRHANIWLDNLGKVRFAQGQFDQAIETHEEALVVCRKMGDLRSESYQLLGLGRALLAAGEPSEAQQCFTEAVALNVPETCYKAALMSGIALLHQRNPAAREAFENAIARCRAMLDKTSALFEPRYALAAALVGVAVCDPRWAGKSEDVELLAPALAEYRRALQNCSASGVVRDTLHDLKMIRAANVSDLEPVFELLGAGK